MQVLDFSQWPLLGILVLFLVAALVIAVAGTRMAKTADRLADVTGLGEAMFGAILLGGSTSLPGIITSVTTAYQGYPQLSVSNAVGGIAVQTAFLAVADMTYRRVNLEHAAASLENIMQGVLLSTLLAIPLLAMAGPDLSFFGIHPATLLLLAMYVFSQRMIRHARQDETWQPKQTADTQPDDSGEEKTEQSTLLQLSLTFAILALVVGAAGYTVAQTGIALTETTGLSETIIGALFTAIATSLPELVTSVAAVRQGALMLAVGGIIGGNSFDTLFLALSDVAYQDGSIYHTIDHQQVFVLSLTLLLTGILLLGLLRRQERGPGNIGFESILILLFYAGGFVMIFFM